MTAVALVVFAAFTVILTFLKSALELIATFRKNRSNTYKSSEEDSAPLELIVRKQWKDGEVLEERILRIPMKHAAATKILAETLKD